MAPDFNDWKRNIVLTTSRMLALSAKALFLFSFFSIIVPANAIDYGENAMISLYPRPYILPGHDAAPYIPRNEVPRMAAGVCTGLLVIVGGHLSGAVKTLLGPLMGITSVLWFIMRNDAAVKPGFSWL
jgi:hypothetical protein